ncbi:G-type lectin S-receptor-like serine/threonine-protein kinase At1g11410 [Malus sylvestris]|uniref:G-type lectin S-receptor-like serine/threonine-protein kinase At1g11410 n=1 Tax=Malus sylvestris TaxID=3752 RepID=UPI0021AC4306|nr:G-type lectin S-receptor-like serine/threonine-protein kinase At1g11410 [Malus sylvestris]
MLPFMKLGLNRQSGLNRFLTSWKSQDDLGTGNCSYRIEPGESPLLFLYKGQTPLWRAGSWTGEGCSGVPAMTKHFIFNAPFVNNQDEVSVMYGIVDEPVFSKMVIDESGILERSTWQDQVSQWVKVWSAPVEQCDFYGKCGPNSICDAYTADKFECNCLPGFEPKLQRDGSGGCVRQNISSVCQNGGFVKLEDERQGGSGCITWHGDLMDTRTYSDTGQDLYVRVDAIVLAQYAKKPNSSFGKKRKIGVSVACGLFFFLLFSLACWLVKRKRSGKSSQDKFFSVTTASTHWEDSSARIDIDESRVNSKLPFFELRTIAKATNNFASNNEVGTGSFDSVCKGWIYTELGIC